MRDHDCAYPDGAFALSYSPSTGEVDNDCACPDGSFNLRHQTMPFNTFYQATNSAHTEKLPHGFQLTISPFASHGPAILNPAAYQRYQTFTHSQQLTQPIDHTLAEQMLILPDGQHPQPTETQPETLTAWIHVTNACSLECPYCYVRKSSARMSEETGKQAIDAIFHTAQLHGFKKVKLKYAGGEATLHFKLVRYLHDYAHSLAEEAGLSLKEVVLSNGVHIRPEDADWIVENTVKLMISLDGIGELHNQLRPLKGRKGFDTFSKVEQTIDGVLLERDIRPDITMTITRQNVHGAADVAKWAMIDRGLPTSFNLYRQNALSTSHTELVLEEQAIIEGMLAAYNVIEEYLPTEPFLDGLLDRVQSQAHAHTCGVGQSYVVITHTGKVAQCQMHLDAPVHPTLEGDLLPMVANGPIRNLHVDEKEGCRDCEFRYRCTGGCPLETYRATGRWDIKSPNCHIYKTLMPVALRLEGLRLMKVHGYLS